MEFVIRSNNSNQNIVESDTKSPNTTTNTDQQVIRKQKQSLLFCLKGTENERFRKSAPSNREQKIVDLTAVGTIKKKKREREKKKWDERGTIQPKTKKNINRTKKKSKKIKKDTHRLTAHVLHILLSNPKFTIQKKKNKPKTKGKNRTNRTNNSNNYFFSQVQNDFWRVETETIKARSNRPKHQAAQDPDTGVISIANRWFQLGMTSLL